MDEAISGIHKSVKSGNAKLATYAREHTYVQNASIVD